MDDDFRPEWGNRMFRHFRMEKGRLVVYWATLSRARLGCEDFGKVFG